MSEDKTQAEGGQGGEGDRESDRRYRKHAREFVADDKVDEAAEKAGNMSDEETSESLMAEEIGKSRARDEDPEIEHKTKQ